MNFVSIESFAAPEPSASFAVSRVHAIDLEENPAGLDLGDPVFRRALARAHAHFGRLLRNRHIGEYPNPHAARALHVTRDRAARGFDLPRRDALGLQSPSGHRRQN